MNVTIVTHQQCGGVYSLWCEEIISSDAYKTWLKLPHQLCSWIVVRVLALTRRALYKSRDSLHLDIICQKLCAQHLYTCCIGCEGYSCHHLSVEIMLHTALITRRFIFSGPGPAGLNIKEEAGEDEDIEEDALRMHEAVQMVRGYRNMDD